MCWNQYVSINTFVFGIFTLILIFFNNLYSPYKLHEFKRFGTYFFFMSFISIQAIEYVLWKNLKNDKINHQYSFYAAVLLFIQPVASLFMIDNLFLRFIMIILYLLFMSYNNGKLKLDINKKNYYSSISKSGHLKWEWLGNWLNMNDYKGYIWLFFLFFSLILNKDYFFTVCALFLLIISKYYYDKDKTPGSLWCWSVNIIVLWYLIKLLIWLPYKEHGVCN